jgi:hypothetical protein
MTGRGHAAQDCSMALEYADSRSDCAPRMGAAGVAGGGALAVGESVSASESAISLPVRCSKASSGEAEDGGSTAEAAGSELVEKMREKMRMTAATLRTIRTLRAREGCESAATTEAEGEAYAGSNEEEMLTGCHSALDAGRCIGG